MSAIDASGIETKYEWHPKQYRKTAEIDGLGHRTEWAFDERGNTVLERDALGNETLVAHLASLRTTLGDLERKAGRGHRLPFVAELDAGERAEVTHLRKALE